MNKLITRTEAAEILGLKPSTLSAWACLKTHELPYVRIGSRAMYRISDIEDFINQNLVSGQSQ